MSLPEHAHQTMGPIKSRTLKRELLHLQQLLDEGESILALGMASCRGNLGLLAVSDRRVIFVRRRRIPGKRYVVRSIPLPEIGAIATSEFWRGYGLAMQVDVRTPEGSKKIEFHFYGDDCGDGDAIAKIARERSVHM